MHERFDVIEDALARFFRQVLREIAVKIVESSILLKLLIQLPKLIVLLLQGYAAHLILPTNKLDDLRILALETVVNALE